MKNSRRNKLLEIIACERFEIQKDLCKRLNAFGYECTQATVSRDVKALGIVKVPCGDGTYKYSQPQGEGDAAFSRRLLTIFREGVTSFQSAQNIVVLKTLSGLAMAAAAAVDAMKREEILGSLAGDDTVFLVFADADKALGFCNRVKDLLEGG
ncbi:MAG: arginine repressor [Oscillospiraceae bacterium]|nr:arginine repressor [Oscillospiraceae bacterium]